MEKKKANGTYHFENGYVVISDKQVMVYDSENKLRVRMNKNKE